MARDRPYDVILDPRTHLAGRRGRKHAVKLVGCIHFFAKIEERKL